MSDRDAKAWMREHGGKLPPEEPAPETGRRSKDVGGTGNRVSREAKSLAFAAEMADAAQDILGHPSLNARDRAIWGMVIEQLSYGVIASRVPCSKTTVQVTVERIKGLMVNQGELAKAREAPKAKPPKDEAAEVFRDLERTIELGVHNAHRVITDINTRSAYTTDDVENNERAVRTILNVRKSELEYLRLGRPQPGATPDELRNLAGQEKV